VYCNDLRIVLQEGYLSNAILIPLLEERLVDLLGRLTCTLAGIGSVIELFSLSPSEATNRVTVLHIYPITVHFKHKQRSLKPAGSSEYPP
jgi:hypothetical protein